MCHFYICHSVHGGRGCVADTPLADTPWANTPGRHPPVQSPPGQTPPLGRHPGQTPPAQCMLGCTWDTRPPAPVHAGIHPPPGGHCSGRYASYWNAFLLWKLRKTRLYLEIKLKFAKTLTLMKVMNLSSM